VELSETFVVPCGFGDAWSLLTDPLRYADCVPGAHLVDASDGAFHGAVNLRLGLLTARLVGAASLESDLDRRRITVRASGNGRQGLADAHIIARLEAVSDELTEVSIDADVAFQGRLAQLSSGIIAEVSVALTEQFAQNLSDRLTEGPTRTALAAFNEAGQTMPEPEALDLLDAARRPILKRLIPVVLVAVLAGMVVRRMVRSRNG